jgi:hypothetical protein
METPVKRTKNTFGDMFALGEVFGYFFRKKDPNRKTNFNLKAMHFINKLSIAMFLLGVLYLILKRIF